MRILQISRAVSSRRFSRATTAVHWMSPASSSLSSLTNPTSASGPLLQNYVAKKWSTARPRFSTDSSSSSGGNEAAGHVKESHEFHAETRQLLEIVTNSLYTDKEVFLRELISNASDALEKLRHLQVAAGDTLSSNDTPLEIRIETNEDDLSITITDTGVGLHRDEMIENLGTIAKSGSKDFIRASKLDPTHGIIGKFGVGFYSAFMVGEQVEVRSKSAFKSHEDNPPLIWSSTGSGTYEIEDLNTDIRQDRGVSVVVHLKEGYYKYSDEKVVEAILKKYSNFINFPIYLNGNRLNTIKAVWAEEPGSVSYDTHVEFYKFIANAHDHPLDHIHYRADAPLEIKALFYIPSFHTEKHGMGRMEPGVSLYSQKILIESKCKDILPEWLRFIQGVVDSADLPLAVSREKAQDSALIAKLRKALTRKIISHLSTMARKEPSTYKDEFYKEFGHFLKEGVCQDFEFQAQLSKLLYFETSKTLVGELSSLDEYVSRCQPEQKEIYYLCAPSRELSIQSPYLEAFEKAGREVIFVYTAIDDFVMSNLNKFEDRLIVSAEKGDIDFGDDMDEENSTNDGDNDSEGVSPSRLTKEEANEFCFWFQTILADKVATCKVTTRLDLSPAVVTDNQSSAIRRMMRTVDTQDGIIPLSKQTVAINPKHPIIVGLHAIRMTEPVLARVCAEQIFDNCLVAAGILDDGRSMLGRLNDILLCVVKSAATNLTNVDTKGLVTNNTNDEFTADFNDKIDIETEAVDDDNTLFETNGEEKAKGIITDAELVEDSSSSSDSESDSSDDDSTDFEPNNGEKVIGTADVETTIVDKDDNTVIEIEGGEKVNDTTESKLGDNK